MKSLKDMFIQNTIPGTKHKVGICLSGGGALGFAHIGVLQALEDNHIYPEAVSGSSMGAIIGTLYAAGYTPAQMLQFIKEGKLYKITNIMSFQPTFWKTGLSSHQTILKLINDLIPNNSFEKLEKELHLCASNLSTGKWEIISSGQNLDSWVAASCSIPGVFNAMKINDMFYVDGGLLNNMPSQPLKETCEHIIGSDVVPFTPTKRNLKSHEILFNSLRVAQNEMSQPGKGLCDYSIEPRAIDRFHEYNYDAFQNIYLIGYRSVVQYITDNPEILKLQSKVDNSEVPDQKKLKKGRYNKLS